MIRIEQDEAVLRNKESRSHGLTVWGLERIKRTLTGTKLPLTNYRARIAVATVMEMQIWVALSADGVVRGLKWKALY